MSKNPPYYGFNVPQAGNIPPNPQDVPFPNTFSQIHASNEYPSPLLTNQHPAPTAPNSYVNAPIQSSQYMNNPVPPPSYANIQAQPPSYANIQAQLPPFANLQAQPPSYANVQARPPYAGYGFGSTSNSGNLEVHAQQHYSPGIQAAQVQNPAGPLWVKWHKGQVVPNNAVQGGADVDKAKIYVGRLFHKGDLLPAKVIPEKNVAYVSHNCEEFDYYECEVLCQRNVRWLASSNGKLPPGAIQVGHTTFMEPLYVGRVHHKGSITIGKVHPSHGVCYIPFGGKEKSYQNYEVLIA